MSVKIMMDSASDINEGEARSLGIFLVPMQVTLGGREYYDGVTLLPDEFFNKLKESGDMPQTSLINAFRWEEAFEKATKDGDEGMACFDEVMELNPFSEKAYRLKGASLLARKRTQEACDLFDEAVELMPDNARMYEERGRARLLSGDKDGAVADMKKAIELDPACGQRINGHFNNQG